MTSSESLNDLKPPPPISSTPRPSLDQRLREQFGSGSTTQKTNAEQEIQIQKAPTQSSSRFSNRRAELPPPGLWLPPPSLSNPLDPNIYGKQ